MRVVFIQVKNGLLALACRCMKSMAAAVVSSSTVSIRFVLSGPVSSILPSADALSTPRGELRLENVGIVLGIVRPFRLLLGIEVIEVAEEFVEAVLGRQILVAIAEMVLAELPGCIAERLERLGDGHVAILQSDRAAPGMPTLQRPVRRQPWPVMKVERPAVQLFSRVVVGEHHAFLGDAIDVRRAVAHHADACRR